MDLLRYEAKRCDGSQVVMQANRFVAPLAVVASTIHTGLLRFHGRWVVVQYVRLASGSKIYMICIYSQILHLTSRASPQLRGEKIAVMQEELLLLQPAGWSPT